MTKFKIEKVANMIMIISEFEIVYNAWGEESFTEKKLNNAMKKISNNLNGNCEFIRTI